ncbi:hypothetical protein [Pseudomonas sp. DSV-1]|uniref:hypothetical protein n=1 Tax=Pseudomonas sp. DSV-1 TaxID=3112250 RepID=UPI002DB9CF36|nr:hypothetical protein [Pseudomonas sp. DSV-1]MEC4242061.1 hypothetical protein [Pseudomonas sp. DSV-1]
MRPVLTIIAESLAQWDKSHVSEPALTAVRELAAEGRFEEITVVLQALVKAFGPSQLHHTIQRLPGVVFEYVSQNTEASGQAAVEHWSKFGAADLIRDAALREGQLAVAVQQIINDLNSSQALALGR